MTNILVMPYRRSCSNNDPVEKLRTAAQLIEDAVYDMAPELTPVYIDELIALSYRVAQTARQLDADRADPTLP